LQVLLIIGGSAGKRGGACLAAQYAADLTLAAEAAPQHRSPPGGPRTGTSHVPRANGINIVLMPR
jgi:hypothetical protein